MCLFVLSSVIRERKYSIVKRFCYLLFVVLFSLPLASYARTNPIDSIRSLLVKHTADDTAKVGLYIALAKAYALDNQDSLMAIAHKANTIARNIGYRQGEAKSLMLLGRAYDLEGSLDKATDAIKQALEISKQVKDSATIASAYSGMGTVTFHASHYIAALSYYDSCITISRKTGNKAQQAASLSNIAAVYQQIGNYDLAIKYSLDALKVFEALNDSTNCGIILGNLSGYFMLLNKFDMATVYNNKSLAINKQMHNIQALSSNFYNAARIAELQGDPKTALTHSLTSLAYADSIGDTYSRLLVMSELASLYLQLCDTKLAMKYYEQSKLLATEMGSVMGIVTATAGMADVYMQQKQYNKVIATLTAIFPIAQKEELNQQAISISSILSRAYEQVGDYKNALYYSKVSAGIEKKTFNTQIDEKIQQMEFSYQLDKKDLTIATLEKDKKIASIRSEKKQAIVISLAVGVGLLLIIASILYYNSIRAQKRKQEIQSQRDAIYAQAKKLEELNNFKDVTFAVVSHDLRSPVNTLSSMLSLLNDESITPEMFAEYIPAISQQMNSVNILLNNLLAWSKNHLQQASSENTGDLKIKGLIEENAQLFNTEALNKDVHFKISVPEDLTVIADKGQIDIVIRNLISNAIKFSNRNGTISIYSTQKNGLVQLSVKDEGAGMTPQQLSDIFEMKANKSTHGTEGEKGIGIGLHLSYVFVQQNNAAINVVSEVGNGTIFTITFPDAHHIHEQAAVTA